MKVDIEEYRAKYKLGLRSMLRNADFDVSKLSDEQIDMILQPTEAPENFHQDGEVSLKVAANMWIKNLQRLKIPVDVINQAIRYNFAQN